MRTFFYANDALKSFCHDCTQSAPWVMGIALVKGFYVRLVMTLLVITLVTCIMRLGMHKWDEFFSEYTNIRFPT